jgi:hypothetical protein
VRILNNHLGCLDLDAILRSWSVSGTSFNFPEDAFQTLEEGAIVSVEAWERGTQGNPLQRSSIFVTQTPGHHCEGDFDLSGGVDGYDLHVFAENFGSANCSNP